MFEPGQYALPLGTLKFRDRQINPGAIRRTALLTVEGENDDICSLGQTQAAQDLCSNLPAKKKLHHLQQGVGHYGVFNGSRFRKEIVPRIVSFVNANA